MEIWYQDRSNNWLPVVDLQRNPLTVTVPGPTPRVSTSTAAAPIRSSPRRCSSVSPEPTMRDCGQFYVVGLSEALVRRLIYNRSAVAVAPQFVDEQDVMGNVITAQHRDWDASLAIDDRPYTFWKSAPQPDPMAVCALYLDLWGRTDRRE